MKNQILKNIIFFIGFISLLSFSFVKDNFILWQENKKLKIQDFKAENKDTIKVNRQQFLGAISAIRIEYSSFQRNKNSVPDFSIKTYFDPNESWMLLKNDYVLQHEQIHFDLTELYARKMRKSVESLRQKNVTNISIYRKKIQHWNVMKEKASNQFDADNQDYYIKIGQKILFQKNPKQEAWKKKVDRELFQYSLFKNAD
ncbi:regulator of G-protein signaling domain-containing protein [Cloacibacterium normanense]|uniref:Uncharacterized protein n=1 Tax=Cloacibacterium normanense TaxID=237258 RepID=A0A1E5UF17_9FLAO|nr:hypothetical protein [Cloacibacterium normanense]AZI69623.1 hypothetical protein EB819_06910 [Cloacibacterium normanense]OEL11504.1 hypothetical protein BHF72_2050 [Cloacibacterium normanense]SDO83695.1 hypothetical protein SAMN04489756_12137 [Cloacibacterium normanense]